MKTILKDESEFETISEILQNNYPELYKAIQNDEYLIHYEDFDAFCEIKHDDNIIGFYTFQIIDEITTVINEIYLLKNYRGNNIAIDIILDFYSLPNTILHLRNPNENMIKTLIKNGFAAKIKNNITYSFFPFLVSSDELYRNPKIKRFYRNSKDEFLTATFWDNDLKCSIAISEDREVAKVEGTPLLFEPRKDDLKKYKLRKKFKKITPSFLEKELEKIVLSLENSEEFISKIYEKLEESDSINNLPIPPNLSKDDVKRNFENISLNPRYSKLRLTYLAENPDKIDCELDMDLLPDNCPYCGNEIMPYYFDCPNCAYSFQNLINNDLLNIDGDNRLYTEVMDKIHENNWNEKEIYTLQCLCGCYEYIRMTHEGMYLPITEVDGSNKLRKGSVLEYALENGYLRKCSYDDYIYLIENEYSKDELKDEARFLDLKPNFTKRGIIKQIKETKKQSFYYLETDKGMELYKNCEILNFYMNNLRTFLFCEFKKFVDEHDMDLDESGDAFIKAEYEKGIKNKNWRVYKQLLKYKLARSENAEENLKLAIQTLIYDINSTDTENPAGIDVEFDTLMYLMESLQYNLNTEEIFEKAYDEFELSELKHNKDKVQQILREIESGNYLNQIKDMLI